MSITGPLAWKKTSRSERALSLSFRWFPSPHRSPQLLSMHKLLIVDDETGIRESLEGVLADEGYETASTESGEECLKLLRREHNFEVVVFDIWVPGIDGLGKLGRNPKVENTPQEIMNSRHGTNQTTEGGTQP